jgi:hypothetical protein
MLREKRNVEGNVRVRGGFFQANSLPLISFLDALTIVGIEI